MSRRYIGITGFATAADINAALACAALMPPTRRFMAGVLVSAKTLRGETSPRRRYPTLAVAREIVQAVAVETWAVAHYNTRATGGALFAELCALREALPGIQGIQLNIVSPDAGALEIFRAAHPGVEIILQVNRSSLPGDAKRGPANEVDDYARRYVGLVDHALVDFSGGTGKPLDLDLVRNIADHWSSRWPTLGAAGGLDAASVGALRGLDISCDTESRVRTPDDDLDHGHAVAFVRAAAEVARG